MTADVAMVNYVGSKKFIGKEGNTYFNLTVVDNEGDTLRFFCSDNVYSRICNCELGQALSLILKIRDTGKGMSVRLEDVVL